MAVETETVEFINCNNKEYEICDAKAREKFDAIDNLKDMAYEEKVNYPTVKDLNNAVVNLQRNFQAGVNAVYNAVYDKGVTPASKSLEDIVTAIGQIETGGTYDTLDVSFGPEGTTYDAKDYPGIDAQNIVRVVPPEAPFTVKFFDIEDNLLETTEVIYGGSAVYHGSTPVMNGMRFVGQNPSPTFVTQHLNCHPKFENIEQSPDIIVDDQITIARKVQTDPDYYPIGHYKVLELQDGTPVRMQLVAKNADILEGESGYAPTTWVAMTVFDINFNPSGYGNCGGYYCTPDQENDGLRDYLQTTFLQNKFPQELVPYLKTVIKYTSGYTWSDGTRRADYPTLDNIQIPSTKEISNSGENLGTFYDVAFGVDGQPNQDARKRPYYNGNYNGQYAIRTGTEYGYYINNHHSTSVISSSGKITKQGPMDSAYTEPYIIGFCL